MKGKNRGLSQTLDSLSKDWSKGSIRSGRLSSDGHFESSPRLKKVQVDESNLSRFGELMRDYVGVPLVAFLYKVGRAITQASESSRTHPYGGIK
ncbi:MAG: hypothetical protein KKF56_03195 [Nanoarchaeota archaeon]|nr:hypothetical protein [Nanoarchaeota archaeon]